MLAIENHISYPASQTLELLIESAVRRLLRPRGAGTLEFGRVTSAAHLAEVGRFRRRQYARSLPYMLGTLGPSGIEAADERSFVYSIRWDGHIVGTARLSPYPFEVMDLVSEEHLDRFLEPGWRNCCAEWSRLVVDTEVPIRGMLAALLALATLDALTKTDLTQYAGYCTPTIRKSFERFAATGDTRQFVIPSRGTHRYTLIKGDFLIGWREIHSKYLVNGSGS